MENTDCPGLAPIAVTTVAPIMMPIRQMAARGVSHGPDAEQPWKYEPQRARYLAHPYESQKGGRKSGRHALRQLIHRRHQLHSTGE